MKLLMPMILLAILPTKSQAQSTLCRQVTDAYGKPAVQCDTKQSTGIVNPNYAETAISSYERGRRIAEMESKQSEINNEVIDSREIEQEEARNEILALINRGKCREATALALRAIDIKTSESTMKVCVFLNQSPE